VVAVQAAPQGTKRVAKAVVDAADALALFRRSGVDGALGGKIRIDQPFQGLEGTAILLAHPAVAHRLAFAGDEVGRDARTFLPGDADALPGVAPLGPFAPEEAALAEGRTEADEPALRDGEHGADAAIQVVLDAGRLVDDEQGDTAEGTDGL